MKREHWFLAGGIAIGLMLGGARCSFKVNSDDPSCKRIQLETGAVQTPPETT